MSYYTALSYTFKNEMEPTGRLELPTSALRKRRSSQLSYIGMTDKKRLYQLLLPFTSETAIFQSVFYDIAYRTLTRARGVAWPNTPPCHGGDRRFKSGRARQ